VTRVAIVAAPAAVRAGLEMTVGASELATLAAAAATVDALLADSGLASSDVVLIHAGAGEVAARRLDALPPIPVVVLVGRSTSPDAIQSMLSAGVRGVLPEDASGDEVLAAVGAAAAGLIVVAPEMVGEVVSARPAASAGTSAYPPGTRSGARASALTPREREILAMLAEGLPNKVIASRLHISEHTVKTHLEALFDKLGASTRAEAVARGVRQGLLLL
jgi:DNA-binding NarL/FixJ family response regulator